MRWDGRLKSAEYYMRSAKCPFLEYIHYAFLLSCFSASQLSLIFHFRFTRKEQFSKLFLNFFEFDFLIRFDSMDSFEVLKFHLILLDSSLFIQ